MTISDLAMIVAVIAGPILAVQAQKYLENIRDKKERKVQIFKTLMATRGTVLSPLHVEALNRIDLEFGKRKKDKKVIEAWKLYLDHLNNRTDPQVLDFSSKLAQWGEKANELLIELLYSMSQALGYDFDKVLLKRGIYTPQGHVNLEFEQNFIRKRMVEILSGNKVFPVKVVGYPNLDKIQDKEKTLKHERKGEIDSPPKNPDQ